MFRATKINIAEGQIVQGGSTLTQQLVKNLYLSPEKSIVRKIKEAAGSIFLELTLPKKKMLEWYLNQIYLGYDYPYNICGVHQASLFYFAKKPSELSLSESALLAGLVPAPGYLNPYQYPERALSRRNTVLLSMLETGLIDSLSFHVAIKDPMILENGIKIPAKYRYFRDLLERYLLAEFPDSLLYFNGSDIFTTIDPYIQEEAENAQKLGFDRIDSLRGTINTQGALVCIENENYYVRAVIGGRNEQKDLYNRAIQAKRQPGSTFKIFDYLAAMDTPKRAGSPIITPLTILADTPSVFIVRDPENPNDSIWKPKNYNGEYLGLITVRRALERSQNIATSNLVMMVTPKKIVEYAMLCGIESNLDTLPAVGLGASDVSPYELAKAVSTIANYGVRGNVTPVRCIADYRGFIMFEPKPDKKQVVDSSSVYILMNLLEGVVKYGRSHDVRLLGFTRPSCGKTGTTNSEKDAWYAGFTQQYTSVVWTGFDDFTRFGLTGTQAAVPIWTFFNEALHTGLPSNEFIVPSGLEFIYVDHGHSDTTLPAFSVKEYFHKGTIPDKIPVQTPYRDKSMLFDDDSIETADSASDTLNKLPNHDGDKKN
jgi:membrane peptidoglycan carboxypeptidase